MANKLRVLCAVILISANFAYADGNAKVKVSPAPFKDPITGMEMVYVKGGCYKMGDTHNEGGPEEKPVHEVCVKDFYMGKNEVTQGQWQKIMGSNPSFFSSCGNDCPVDNVSWVDAQDFISRLNSKSNGSTYRLPTEAEWEYTARSGGKNEKYSGGDDFDYAWFSANASTTTHPVCTKPQNGLGICDMSGNVGEWTNDWYGVNYYSSSPRKNPAGPSSGNRRVVRGGNWSVGEYDIRTTYRNYIRPNYRGNTVGFRLLRTL